MVKSTRTQSAPMRDSLHSVGTKLTDAFDSFVIRAPKITLLSAKTFSDNTSTSTPAALDLQIPMRASSLPICVEPSVPSSSATARDQLTNGNTRRLPPPPPPTARRGSLAEEKDSGKIPVRAAIRALRRAVAYADQDIHERGRKGSGPIAAPEPRTRRHLDHDADLVPRRHQLLFAAAVSPDPVPEQGHREGGGAARDAFLRVGLSCVGYVAQRTSA
ncbi:hypothetical protein T484DRAFT_1919563 [Baffinella frigidus]|nr:hypothetical protein T484DRAFT_1919563 [Cryptophyta sp. CCMP2293]